MATAPKVPSVGDAHIENWGTWRDAALLPYACDLVRLATSVSLASGIAGTPNRRADWTLSGYLNGPENPKPWNPDGSQARMQALPGRPLTRLGIADDAAKSVVPGSDLPPPNPERPYRKSATGRHQSRQLGQKRETGSWSPLQSRHVTKAC